MGVQDHGDDGSDEEVRADALVAEEDEDDDELMDASASDEDGPMSVAEEAYGGENAAPTRGPRRKKQLGANAYQNSYHELPPYPLEPRLMSRIYTGPLRRYARYGNLRDTMYGPEFSRIKTIWELDSRWTSHQILPPKFPPEHANGIMPSPGSPRIMRLSRRKRRCSGTTRTKGNLGHPAIASI